ncbi:MAG: YlxR family protein [Cyanobacteria bacterium J06621_8]
MNQTNYRQCISCKKKAPKDSFWRVVRSASSHKIELDRGMGRSAYICPTLECLLYAKTKNRLNCALRTKVPDDIYQNLRKRLS